MHERQVISTSAKANELPADAQAVFHDIITDPDIENRDDIRLSIRGIELTPDTMVTMQKRRKDTDDRSRPLTVHRSPLTIPRPLTPHVIHPCKIGCREPQWTI